MTATPADTDADLRRRAVLITIAGVMVLSTDAVLIRLIDAGPLTVSFWRGLLMAIGFWTLHVAQTRRFEPSEILLPSGMTLVAALLYMTSSLSFVGAIKNTDVANALLIIATVPLTTALISRLVLGERIARATWLAIAGALIGLTLVFGPDLGTGNTLGNLLALTAAAAIGGYFTVLRSGRVPSALPALTLAGIGSALVAAPLAGTLAMPATSVPFMVLLGLIVIPVSFALISLGPKNLPAAEVGLIILLETVFGTTWALIVLGDVPGWNAVVGGAIVLASLVLRALATRRRPYAKTMRGK